VPEVVAHGCDDADARGVRCSDEHVDELACASRPLDPRNA
jgi:hypothetical protein